MCALTFEGAIVQKPKRIWYSIPSGISARSRVQQGKLAKAELLCKRALEIRERTVGLDHPDVVTSLTTLGSLLEKQVRATEM